MSGPDGRSRRPTKRSWRRAAPSSGLAGKLCVSAAVTFARIHLMPRLPEFLAQHPDLEMEVVLDDRNIDLVREGIDVALRMGKLADSSLIARRIASCRHVVLGTPAYFERAGLPTAPSDLAAHQAVIYGQRGGGAVWPFRREGVELTVTLHGRLHVSAAEGVRAAVFANAGIAITSEWMFAPEIVDGTVKAVLQDWELPPMDLWAVFPAGRTPIGKSPNVRGLCRAGDARVRRSPEVTWTEFSFTLTGNSQDSGYYHGPS